jgi:hypothetical protein
MARQLANLPAKFKRYSPTRVTRRTVNRDDEMDDSGQMWRTVAEYDDATVMSMDISRLTHGPQAMLRVYVTDPEFEDPYGERWFDEKDGYWKDADSDLDLERTVMNVSHVLVPGHGTQVWTGFVGRERKHRFVSEEDEAKRDQWTGWSDSNEYRLEEWWVSLVDEDKED